jgi:phosphoribosylamine--glycine ligase
MGKTVGVVGSGGREHTIAWKLAQSQNIEMVYMFPGNGGTATEPKVKNVAGLNGSKNENFSALHGLIRDHSIDYLVVGPEQPLADGIVDHLSGQGYGRVFGPKRTAAQIESDKVFSYNMMQRAGIPQARSIVCANMDEARAAVREMSDKGHGIVFKTKGLAAGKGVYVCQESDNPMEMLTQHCSEFGEQLLVAEKLYGEEFSVFGISDGKRVIPFMMSAQDHKPLLADDLGPNTGGMGAYSPAPVADAKTVAWVTENIMNPAVRQMGECGIEYKGFLYAGLMRDDEDQIKVIEFNCRFGDPEAQPVMMMLGSDLDNIICNALDGRLSKDDFRFRNGAAVCVVMASNGYPGKYEKGYSIGGIDDLPDHDKSGVKVFHAGTSWDGENFLTNGGRVLGVTAFSGYEQRRTQHRDLNAIRQAQQAAYYAVQMIDEETTALNHRRVFMYRPDIAAKAMEYLI